MMLRKYLLAFCLVILIYPAGCSDDINTTISGLKGQVGTFFRLSIAINAMLESGHSNLNMHNNRILTVDLVNTEYNNADSDKRAQIAEDIANYLLGQIEDENGFNAIDTIVVEFVHYEKKYLVVDYTRTIDHYDFQVVDREKASIEKTAT